MCWLPLDCWLRGNSWRSKSRCYLRESWIPTQGQLSLRQFPCSPALFLLDVSYACVNRLDFVARATSSLFLEYKNVLFSTVSLAAIKSISLNAVSHLHQLDHSFHLGKNTGSLIKSIDRANRGLAFLCTSLIFNVLPTTFEIGLVTAILANHFGRSFAICGLGTIGTYAAFTFLLSAWRTSIRREMNRAESTASARAYDSLINHEAVKAFGGLKHELEEYSTHLEHYNRAAEKSSSSLFLLNAGQNAIFSASIAGMMWMVYIKQPALSAGDLVFLNALMMQLTQPLNFLGTIYREIKQAIVDVENLTSLTSTRSLVEDKGTALLSAKSARISFDRVSFCYPGSEREILRSISLSIAARSRIGIVGVSGSGKSTIAKLLFRFFDCTDGAISIDDQNIKDVTLESLRRKISLVPQDVALFNRSIFYNIAYGNLHATEERVYEIAKAVGIDSFVSKLPSGYETLVGERGLMLSGGEKQRIALARALLKDAPILVFDEATSSLDAETEAFLIGLLEKEIFNEKTIIMIAHRLQSLRFMDEIVVIGKDGSISERGTHLQLLQIEGGIYQEMWSKANFS